MSPQPGLRVGVTGPTGTFGFGLIPRLQADDHIGTIVGIARRRFDPMRHGWTKMEYRQGDVRERGALEDAFKDVDVVVHLAFVMTGMATRATMRAVNIDGTMNAFRAATAAGVKRFVHASSVGVYGHHPDNPIGMTEDWPIRPAVRLFYEQHKVEVERRLVSESASYPATELYLLRPAIVVGPHAVGAKDVLPQPFAPIGRRLARRAGRPAIPVPALVPDVPVQLVHEADVGQAFHLSVLAAGPPGAYNIAADDVLTGTEIARELGLAAIPVPSRPVHTAARAVVRLPALSLAPPAAEWIEWWAHPAVMDSGKARRDLGWSPHYTGIDALRDTLRRGP